MQGNFLGNGKVVLPRPLPVDEVDGFCDLAGFDLHQHAVAQQIVDGLIIAVETAAMIIRLGAQGIDRPPDLRRSVAAPGQVGGEQSCLNVAVAVAVGPIAQVAVAKLIAKESNDTLLRDAFRLADSAHGLISLCRICPTFLLRNQMSCQFGIAAKTPINAG